MQIAGMCCRIKSLSYGPKVKSGHRRRLSAIQEMLKMSFKLKVCLMGRLVVVFLFGMAAVAPSFAGAGQQQMVAGQPPGTAKSASAGASTLPPPPAGKPTVIGGIIRSVDPVRDQLNLKVFGGKPMKMLFDARTQVYRDGKKVSLSDLHPEERASVETVLDGTDIYALNIHMLSQSPEGSCEGQVVDFNSGSGELTVSANLSRAPIKLLVPAGTPIVWEGQLQNSRVPAGPSAIVPGSLISVDFKAGSRGRGVATHVGILAAPGSQFIFSGNITALDLHSGLLALVDPTDDKSYQVHFDSAALPVKNLHEGERVTVRASFDGSRYEATSISGGS